MAHRRRGRDLDTSPVARAVALVAVAVLGLGVVALSVLALQRDRGTVDPAATAAPAPTFSYAPADGTAPASPSPSPAAATSPGADERFLARGSAGTLWRATAGACGVTAPLVERSDDDGDSWVDVTPRYRQIGQVRALSGFSGTEAEMVADLAACEPEWLRTFTQGRFWEPYPELLESAVYLAPGASSEAGTDAAATLRTPTGDEPLPCAAPWSLRVGAQQAALVCDGTAHVRVGDGEWSPLPVADARAVDVVGRESAVAHVSTACPGGLAVSIVDADGATSPAGCVASVDANAPVAIAAFDDEVLVWAGDAITRLPR